MNAGHTSLDLDQCLAQARRAIIPMCRASAKRLRCDPEELVGEVLEKIFLRLSSGQPIVNIVHYARRYARCLVKRKCTWADDQIRVRDFDRRSSGAGPLERIISLEESRVVQEEIEKLPDADRRIVLEILGGEPPQRSYRDVLGRRLQAIRLFRHRLAKRGIQE